MAAMMRCVWVLATALMLAFSNSMVPISAQAGISSKQPAWKSIDFPVLPQPRPGFAMTLNPVNKIALVFSGMGGYGEPDRNDLWMTNGRQWMEFSTPDHPEGRTHASMAYDEKNQAAVLFGGFANSTGNYFNDTWLYNGIDWLEQQPKTSPPERAGASMIYNPERNHTYLFGGNYDIGKEYWTLGDMWAWDGTNWQEMFPAHKPGARTQAPIAYDSRHKNILLFGGYAVAAPLQDTWIWDGTDWIEQHPLHSPSLFFHDPEMAYDATRQQVIMVGTDSTSFENTHTETWAWDGQDWTELQMAHPLSREMAYGSNKMVYMPELQTVMIYSNFVIRPEDPNEPVIVQSGVWALVDQFVISLPLVAR